MYKGERERGVGREREAQGGGEVEERDQTFMASHTLSFYVEIHSEKWQAAIWHLLPYSWI